MCFRFGVCVQLLFSARLEDYVIRQGGLCAKPFILDPGPSILGIGFLVALTVLMRGTPCRTRGSFISVGSSLAGAVWWSEPYSSYVSRRVWGGYATA